MSEITYLEAIRAAIADAMREDERVFVLGEDIGHFGGPFGVTKGLLEEFGEERLIDTPISEEAFVGAALGAAWMGERPIAELQFADFITCPFDVLMTVGAKTHWRSGIRLPMVLRAPFGGGVRGGPFHASSPGGVVRRHGRAEGRLPGIGRGRLRAASSRDRRRRPGRLLRAKGLYRRLRGDQPEPAHRTPIGRARVVRPGSDATIVTYGAGVDLAVRAVEELDVEILDLRTVWPLDNDAVLESLAKTSRILVLQEAARSIGAASHVLSLVAREGFELLDAPPVLVAPPDTPVPFAPELEDAYIPSAERVRAELEELLAF